MLLSYMALNFFSDLFSVWSVGVHQFRYLLDTWGWPGGITVIKMQFLVLRETLAKSLL